MIPQLFPLRLEYPIPLGGFGRPEHIRLTVGIRAVEELQHLPQSVEVCPYRSLFQICDGVTQPADMVVVYIPRMYRAELHHQFLVAFLDGVDYRLDRPWAEPSLHLVQSVQLHQPHELPRFVVEREDMFGFRLLQGVQEIRACVIFDELAEVEDYLPGGIRPFRL